MNQGLKELLTPKLLEWGADSDDNFSEELQKFAELIVKECANVASDFVRGPGGDHAVKRAIQKHFGVEE